MITETELTLLALAALEAIRKEENHETENTGSP